MSIPSRGFSRHETSGRALFSPREAEEILGVSHATLYRLIAAGRLDARKLQSKTVITAASLQQLIDTLPNLRSTRNGRAV